MIHPVFITGNQSKADYLNKFLSMELEHQKVDLKEIQSLDLHEVVEYKAKQAYALIGKPILVDDASLEFVAFGHFPGTFIRFLCDEADDESICRSLDNLSRDAIRRTTIGLYDGKQMIYFDTAGNGTIAKHPSGTNGFGWDTFFIPEGYAKTRADMNDEEYEETYIRKESFTQLKEYLENQPHKGL